MLRRNFNRLSLLSINLLAVSCITHGNSTPSALPLGSMSTTATYDVLGDATGTSKGAIVLWFFQIEGENKSGSVAGGSSSGGGIFSSLLGSMPSPVEAAAIYNAIESVPGADALISPRFHRDIVDYLGFYRTEVVTVTGKAIRINPSVEPDPK